MDDLDLRLKAAFAEDEPPARDADFQASVMAAVARRELVSDLVTLAGLTAIGGAALWALWPALHPAIEALGEGAAPVAAVLGVGLTLALILGAKPMQALGLDS